MVKTRDLGEDGIIYRPDVFHGKFEGLTWIAYMELMTVRTER